MTHARDAMNRKEKEILPSSHTSRNLPSQLLSLDFVHKVKVGLVKVVNTDITILSTRGIGCTGGVNVDGI